MSTRRLNVELNRLPERARANIVRLVEELRRRGLRIKAVYLFGSFARGDWLVTSDVDIVIISPDFEGMRFIDRLDLVYMVAWKLGLRPWIEAIPLTPRELEEKLKSSSVIRDASRYWIRIV